MANFEIKDDFYLDGARFQVISGSMHYFRVVPEYWRDRLLKLKAMGCNTVETYVPWNFHEPRPGHFDFTGMKDVEAFLRLAQEVGLYAIVRPSPYICAEWEFGGLPAWLLTEDMRLRSSDPRFLAHVRAYYDELMPRLAALQVTHGGPILMMQVENEYGSYGDEQAYLAALRDMMLERGVDVPLVTSDGPEHDMLACGRVDGVFQTGNFGSHTKERFTVMAQHGIKPLMCMEFWCGWFDHWGAEHHAHTDAAASAKDFADALDLGHINVYMFHGGTSFGFMNGANDYDALTPDVTSYDYDALLTEDGRATEKYRLFQAAIEARKGKASEVMPPETPRRAYGEATETAVAPLVTLARLSGPDARVVSPVSMERVGQAYGNILYHTRLTNELELRDLRLLGANDRATVLLNGKPILTLYDRELLENHHFDVPVPVRKYASLDILVENMGRVNYSWKLEHQRKGIDGGVLINGHLHSGWEIDCLDEAKLNALAPAEPFTAAAPGVPSLRRLSFRVDEPADTFLALPGWGKGVVFLNGFTLGRFWEIGPQKRLYIPAPLLKTGENELLILETEGRTGQALLLDEPKLG